MKSIMSKVLKFFILNKIVKNKDVKTLLINIAIYIGIGIALGIYKAIVCRIPLLGNLSYNAAGLYKIYAWVGAILAAIQYFSNDDYSDVEYVTLEDIKNLWNLKNGKIAIIVAAAVLCLVPNINRELTVGSNDKKEDTVASSNIDVVDTQEEYSDNRVDENSEYEETIEDTSIVEETSSSETVEEIAEKFIPGTYMGEVETAGLVFAVYDNGAEVTGTTGTVTDYIIPESVELENVTYEVKSIAGQVFQYDPLVYSIDMPNTITTIGDISIKECKFLTDIHLSDNLTYVGFGSISGNSSLDDIVLPVSLREVGEMSFCGNYGEVIIRTVEQMQVIRNQNEYLEKYVVEE